MKHWQYGPTDNHSTGITLKVEERVICIGINKEGKIFFEENCDGYFGFDTTKEIAVEMLQEAIEWIRGQGDEVSH